MTEIKIFCFQSFNHSTCLCRQAGHSIYLALTILFVIAINTQAQVVIKEKVEINPQSNIVPEYPVAAFTPCGPWITSYDYFNPWQVVWNQISFAPDPYQQMFNFQDNRYGPGLQRRIYTLDPNNNYNLTIQQEEEYAYFTYGGFYDDITGVYVPMQYVGTALSGVPGSDIGATAWFNYVRDYPNGLYRNDSKYRMRIKRDVPSGTEITMTVFNGQETINYHTRIEVPTFTIESSTDEDTLLHYYSRDIEFILNFQQSCQLDGYGGAYPSGIKFNVEIIQGQEYGNLYYPGTVADPEQSGTSITNLDDEYGIGIANYTIKYKADGVQPDSLSPGIVTIRCSANDIDIAPVEVSFPVKYNDDPPDEGGYIIVGMDKQSYEPGDTAVIFNRWLTGYGEDIYFPVNQLFDVEITAGTEYGVLYDPYSGEVSGSLQNVLNGFRVLTSSSIAEDSVVIILKVRTRVGGGISTRMITNEKDELERREINKAEDKEPYNTESLIIGEEELEGYGNVLVKKDGCDDAPRCTDIAEAPWIELKKIDDPKICSNSKKRGGFEAKLSNPFLKIDIDACYNQDEDKWQFKIIPENKIFVKYSLEICINNLRNNYKLIESLDALSTIPDDSISICGAYSDILWHQIYGAVRNGHYFIYETTVNHENHHLTDFVEIMNELYFNKYYDKFLEFSPSCSTIKNLTLAKKNGAKNYYNYMEAFRKELKNNLLEKTGKKGSEKRKKYEQSTQDKLKGLIAKYYYKLTDLHPDKKPCEYCKVGCPEN
ncbi:hypothetical protein [Schleiferia thermophila]